MFRLQKIHSNEGRIQFKNGLNWIRLSPEPGA